MQWNWSDGHKYILPGDKRVMANKLPGGYAVGPCSDDACSHKQGGGESAESIHCPEPKVIPLGRRLERSKQVMRWKKLALASYSTIRSCSFM